MDKKTPPTLRSHAWFGTTDKNSFIHRSWMKNQGLPNHLFDGRPVIGICNTWSELTPCNAHFRELAEYVKKGVYEAGGFPVEFPVMSLGESNLRPTAMLFRNLASMDVEESIRGNPIDGVILLVRMRQNDAFVDDGCSQLQLTYAGRFRRSNAQRVFQRAENRFRYRRLADVRCRAGGKNGS